MFRCSIAWRDATSENSIMFGSPVDGTIGNVGTPGAPVLNFSLVNWVGPVLDGQLIGSVVGHVHITQAVSPPVDIKAQVHGKSYMRGEQMFIEIIGVGAVPFAPPAIGSKYETITATIAVESMRGAGVFAYGGTHVGPVPV